MENSRTGLFLGAFMYEGQEAGPRVFYPVDRGSLTHRPVCPSINDVNSFMRGSNPMALLSGIRKVGPFSCSDGTRLVTVSRVYERDIFDSMRQGGRLTNCLMDMGAFFDPQEPALTHEGEEPTDKTARQYLLNAMTAGRARRAIVKPTRDVPIDDLVNWEDHVIVSEPLLPWLLLRNVLSVAARLVATGRKFGDRSSVLEDAGFIAVDVRDRVATGGSHPFAIPLLRNQNESADMRKEGRVGPRFINSFSSMIDWVSEGLPSDVAVAWRDHGGVRLVAGTAMPHTVAGISYAGFSASRLVYLTVSGRSEDQGELASHVLATLDKTLYRPRLSLTFDSQATDEVSVEAYDLATALWSLFRSHPNHYMLTCRRCHSTVYSMTHGPERQFCSDACRIAYRRSQERAAMAGVS